MRIKRDSFKLATLTFAFLFCLGSVSYGEAQNQTEEKPVPPKAAAKPKPGDVYKDPVTGMELVLVKMGCYAMGDAAGDGAAEEKPVHKVCVDALYVGKYEVTVGQFRKFVDETGYKTDAERNTSVSGCWAYDQRDKEKSWDWRSWSSWQRPNRYQKNLDDHPVACVSWNDAMAFAGWLTQKTGKDFSIATEAEWEYVARGGTKTRNYWGDGKDDACTYANVADLTPLPGRRGWTKRHECNDGYPFAAPVGRFQPNAYGLYDMIGNVCEWTWDWYDNHEKGFYAKSPLNNPRGASIGTARVFRGGSWFDDPGYARAAFRGFKAPEFRSSYLGFRLILKP